MEHNAELKPLRAQVSPPCRFEATCCAKVQLGWRMGRHGVLAGLRCRLATSSQSSIAAAAATAVELNHSCRGIIANLQSTLMIPLLVRCLEGIFIA